MAGNTKNLGQVSGVYIGSTPPENIIMIWYDNTPSQMVHKVYNPGLSQWVVLDQNVISSITYSELVNIATNVGLTVGQWFKITDKSNALALAVTSTKVQYSDSLGNILIDDLGSNIQYHVSSSNLSIDDVVGVFDEVNKKLVFQFGEQVPDYTADDYILGKVKRNNVWSLAKFKLSSFLSKVTGNSITWNGGFFFNFSSAISAILDKKGGVVSKDTYDIDKQNMATDIQNVGKENQTIIENVNTAISNATSATAIYNKQTPAIETGGEPTDVATGDKLITIVSKFQRYINKFKLATGIKISKNFNDGTTPEYINNNDTVESAFRKVQYWLKNMALSSNFAPKDYTGTIGDISASMLYEEAFSILQGKLNQIGDISDGLILSKEKTIDVGMKSPKTIIDLKNGLIILCNKANANKRYIKIDSEEASIRISYNILPGDRRGVEMSGAGMYSKASGITNDKTTLYEISDFNSSALYYGIGSFIGVNTSDENFIAGIIGKADNLESSSPSPAYGGYFEKIKISGLYLRTKIFKDDYPNTSYFVQDKDSLIVIKKETFFSIFLPTDPYIGQTIRIIRPIGGTMNISVNPHVTDKILQTDGNQTTNYTLAPYSVVVLYYIGGLWVFDK